MAGRLISACGLRAGLAMAGLGLLLAGAVAANEKPDANKDKAVTRQNKPVVIHVLANDSDPDGDPLVLMPQLKEPAKKGICARSSDSTLTYTPNQDFTGGDKCRYQVYDGTWTVDAKVEIKVEENEPPEAREDTASTAAGRPAEIAVLANDRDRNEIDTLKVVDVQVSDPAKGQAQIRGDTLVVYAPALGFSGQEHLLTYWVSDGDLQDSAAVKVTVAANQSPLATDDDTTATAGETIAIAVLTNDTDPDGDPLKVVEVMPADSSRSAVEIRSDSLVVYTSHANSSGTDSLVYAVSDGQGGLDTATVWITIVIKPQPINQPPRANDDVAATEPGKAVRIEPLKNDVDPDGDELRIASVGTLTNGKVEVAGDSLSMQYTPNPGFSGKETFQYAISDGQGGTAEGTITVNVAAQAAAPQPASPTDQPPHVRDDQAEVTAGQKIKIPVLSNDRDPEGKELHVVAATKPQRGDVSVAQDRKSVTYEATDSAGEERFTYTVSDGQQQAKGTVVVRVTAPSAPATVTTKKTGVEPGRKDTTGEDGKIKPVVEPGISPWIYAGGGVFALALVVVLVVYFTRKKAPPPGAEEAPHAIEVKLAGHSLRLGNAQGIGARPYQEDAFGFSNWEDAGFLQRSGLLAVVADGMGGLEQGNAASNAAVRAFIGAYEGKTPNESTPEGLLRALHEANRAVLGVARKAGAEGNVGTTLVAVVVHEGALHWVSVGDSRIYLARGGQLAQLTEDHVYASHLAREVARGAISKDEAESHPEREALTSFVGLRDLEEIERSTKAFPLQPGDFVLLCSDGVYKNMTDAEVAGPLQGDPQTASENLVQAVLAKQDRHQDNLTVVVLAYRQQD